MVLSVLSIQDLTSRSGYLGKHYLGHVGLDFIEINPSASASYAGIKGVCYHTWLALSWAQNVFIYW